MAAAVESTLLLNNGKRMPIVGLGTWTTETTEVSALTFETAFEAGYRLVDSAFAYENERQVGKALKEVFDSGKFKREDIFIVTKLPGNGMHPDSVKDFLEKSLKNLQVKYVDLYLIHVPIASKRSEKDEEFLVIRETEHGKDVVLDNINLLDTWKAMESLVDKEMTRSIGLSNFNSKQIKRIYDGARIKPVNNQVECHAYFPQYELLEFCMDLGITLTAYSPLGSPIFPDFIKERLNVEIKLPKLMEDARLKFIAEKYKKTNAQILLRYLIQRGIAVIPKSSNPDRIRENIQIFDFSLDAEDMVALKLMATNQRYFKFDYFKGLLEHPEYPFHIPF